MGCGCEKHNLKDKERFFPRAVVELNSPEKLILFRRVNIPASLGDETMVPPTIGKYYNTLLVYEANGNIYLYSSDGIPTQLSTDVSELREQVNALADEMLLKANTADLSTVALTGEYSDLLNYPQDFTTNEWNALWA